MEIFLFTHCLYDGTDLNGACLLKVSLVLMVLMSLWYAPSMAQLNPLDAAALFDLCDRPGTSDLWANCSDSANACINTANWAGITCDSNKTSIVMMYASLVRLRAC